MYKTETIMTTNLEEGSFHQRRLNLLKDLYPIMREYDIPYLLENIHLMPVEVQHEYKDVGGLITNWELYNELIGKEVCNDDLFVKAVQQSYGSYKNIKEEMINKTRLMENGNCFLVLDRFLNLKIITLFGNNSPYSFSYYPLICLQCPARMNSTEYTSYGLCRAYLDNLNLNKLARRYHDGIAFWASRRISLYSR